MAGLPPIRLFSLEKRSRKFRLSNNTPEGEPGVYPNRYLDVRYEDLIMRPPGDFRL